MNRRLQGILIRKRRQMANWSQETLCEGICAVSYLSKIEQGKTEGSSEVLYLLLRRLGILWREEPEFCRETSNWFEEWYDRLFSGESIRELGAGAGPTPAGLPGTVRSFWTGCCFPGSQMGIPLRM